MTSPLSDIFAGTSEASSVTQAIALNPSLVAIPNNSSNSDRFWSSAKASLTSDIQEVLELDLATASIINRITLDIARFPQTITLEYTADSGQEWLPVLNEVTGQPIILTIVSSYPAVLPSPNAITGHNHPQHDYDGHWEHVELAVKTRDMQKIRFVLKRNPLGVGPKDVTGNTVPYSLALQNIYVGFEISAESDIPRALIEDASPSAGTVFANASDIFGSNLGFSKKTQFANNLLFNSDNSAPFIWKSEPQPFPRAVVNFYADLRDRDGNAQIIDQIFIDPLYDGSHISLYYSNDNAGGSFNSSRIALNGNQAAFNNAGLSNGAISLGNYGDTSFLQVNNGYVSFDPSEDWWTGLEFTLGFSQSADSNNHVLFGCSAFQVGFNSTGVFLLTNNADLLTIPITLDSVNPVQLIAAYRGGSLHLSVQQNGVPLSADMVASVNIGSTLPPLLFIGTDPTTTLMANSPIDAFILKQETWVDDSFLNDPLDFSQIPRFSTDEDKGAKNALLRFDPSLVSASAATGLIGGPAFMYETLNWTPIPREYEMHRGTMQLPATRAKFWNLEITNLHSESSEKFIPVSRTAKTFPPAVLNNFTQSTADRSSPGDIGSNVMESLAQSMSFIDSPAYVGTGTPTTGYTATEVYVSDDYNTTQRLQALGNQWQYEQWHADRSAPRFNVVGPHNYTETEIAQTTNISYFTGLRQITFGRQVNTSPQDFSFIEETFLDNQGVTSGNWIPTANGLYSGANQGPSYARTTSILYPTQRPIRGLQFAAQQSDNKQFNTNGEFSDPSYTPDQVSNWTSVGDSKILGLTEANAGGDTALLISRQTDRGFWADISVNYITWGALAVGNGYQSASQDITFATSTSSVVLTYQGIQQSTIQVTSEDGSSHYVLGTDYTIATTDGSKPDAVTTISIIGAGTIPTATLVNVLYNYADAAHPTCVTFGDLKGSSIPAGLNGGISSQPVSLPIGGSIHAAARVTATKALTQPLWIQILDADTGGVISEQQSNVGKSEVKEWYTSVDIKNFNPKMGLKWGDLVGKQVWPSFNDSWASKSNASALPQMLSGQYWTTGTGNPLTVASGAAKVVATNDESTADLKTPWGTLDITLGTYVTGTAQPLIDLGGMVIAANGTVLESDQSATKFTVSPVPASNVRYRFKFMPTSLVPVGQQVSGADPVARPYSILVFTRNNDTPSATETWVMTYSGTRSFGTVRGLSGMANQTYTYFNWTPSNVQVNLTNQILSGSYPATSSLVDTGDAINYVWDDPTTGRHWIYNGVYTNTGIQFISLAPLGFNSHGVMAVFDTKDQYGSLDFNVIQVASGLSLGSQPVAYLNYNKTSGKIITLQADGTIYDQTNAVTLKASMFSSAVNGPLSVRFVSAQTLSSSFKTTYSIGTNTQAMIFLQSNAVVGVYSGNGIWDTTVRGIGGANNGITAGTYTKIEALSWNPDASLLSISSSVTWGQMSYSDTRTYGQMALTTLPSTKNVIVQLIQKTPTLDYWFTESVALFWDPVRWQFSCDGGLTFWEGDVVRNDPNGALLFPYRLTDYNDLVWRVTSYAGDVTINNLTIRPWYQGMDKGIPVRPTQLPNGPNLVTSDHYGPIELDPKWMVWDKPIPRSWWFNFKKTLTSASS